MTPIKYSLNPADVAWLASIDQAFVNPAPLYDSARADVLAQRDRLLAERDAARQSCDMWATKCADQAKLLRRADRFVMASIYIGSVLVVAILGLVAKLIWF